MELAEYFKAAKVDGAIHNPALTFIGAEIEVLEDDRAVISLPVRPEFMQGSGFMQGGLITVLADEAIAHAVMGHIVANDPDKDTATIEVKTNFFYPVRSGKLIADATLVKTGRTIIFAEALVTDDKDRLVAKTTATFMLMLKQA